MEGPGAGDAPQHGREPDGLDPEDAAWASSARPVASFLCDAMFRVSGSVYVGPENGMTPAQWEAERVPLPPPDLPFRAPGWVASTDLAGREEALAAYLDRLIRIARAHGKMAALVERFPYFAVRPKILAGDEVLASWPWSDGLREARDVLVTLARAASAAPGTPILDDQDQGWALRMVAGPGTVLLVEWDAEGPPPADAAWSLEAAVLAGQAAAARDRLRAVHARLVRLMGRDFWS
ncbi:hypothetical protein [Roseomonas indoligenes]|uniref:Uncharacterized protein n=1 Tax=Roseomonas indoligenes TaxID=2820811 RepID=A0A940S6Q5_9PROT|nr:hypothetical protein [Pararoseomonas indoligenes]MBP0494264.1 hypothetical protein [Pararoseomonas indoligenes]